MKIDRISIPVILDEQNEVIPDIEYKYLLKRLDDGLTKRGNNVVYVEWNDDRSSKESHEEPQIGYSLLLDPSMSYTWLTTKITEIVEKTDEKFHFKTQNSEYILYIQK